MGPKHFRSHDYIAIRVGKIQYFKNIMAHMDGQNRLHLAGQKKSGIKSKCMKKTNTIGRKTSRAHNSPPFCLFMK